jgi:hypothetical protein
MIQKYIELVGPISPMDIEFNNAKRVEAEHWHNEIYRRLKGEHALPSWSDLLRKYNENTGNNT